MDRNGREFRWQRYEVIWMARRLTWMTTEVMDGIDGDVMEANSDGNGREFRDGSDLDGNGG